VTFELDHDLTAWADGSLSREDLLTLHGNEALALASLHERLLGAAEMPVPDPAAGWALLQGKMDGKVMRLGSVARPRFRRALLAVAAALLIGGGALAAIREVAFDQPGVVSPPAGSPVSQDGTQNTTGGAGEPAGATDDRPARATSSTAPSQGGSGDQSQGSTGSDRTDTTGDGTSGDTSSGGGDPGTPGGDGSQDPDGQHPGKGNGGEDNGNDGPHGHGGTPSSHA
jgi:hypothetical protein